MSRDCLIAPSEVIVFEKVVISHSNIERMNRNEAFFRLLEAHKLSATASMTRQVQIFTDLLSLNALLGYTK